MQVSNSAFARSITTRVHSTNYKQRLSRVQKPISVSFLLVATCARLTFFSLWYGRCRSKARSWTWSKHINANKTQYETQWFHREIAWATLKPKTAAQKQETDSSPATRLRIFAILSRKGRNSMVSLACRNANLAGGFAGRLLLASARWSQFSEHYHACGSEHAHPSCWTSFFLSIASQLSPGRSTRSCMLHIAN